MNGNTATSSAEPDQPSVEVPQSQHQQSLRQRKKSVRRLSYVVGNDNESNNEISKSSRLTEAQESVFLNMYIRKMNRRIKGKENNDSMCCEFIVVVIIVVVLSVLGAIDDDSDVAIQWDENDTIALVLFLLWVIVAMILFFLYNDSPYAKMMRYMAVYIPVVSWMAGFAFYHEMRDEERVAAYNNNSSKLLPIEHAIFALYIFAEVLTFIGFMFYYKIYPLLVQQTNLLRKPGRVRRFWNVEAIVANDAWTMSYRGHNPKNGPCKMNYTCKYEGDLDPTTGLPDGLGRWLDDAWEGEMLTGYWKQGEPVAPFNSWNVGTDDAVVAVRVGYFKATDDTFAKNKFRPTNDNPPECGVASVECSVSGSFYKHLPIVTLIEGPYVAESIVTKSTEHNPVREVLGHMIVGQASEHVDHYSNEEDRIASINVLATDPRGVQVLGHCYQPTGRYYDPGATSITIDVEWGVGKEGEHPGIRAQRKPSARILQKTLFMPKAHSVSRPFSKLVEVEVECSDEELCEYEEAGDDNVGKRYQSHLNKTATLRVRDWSPVAYKEALIFFPGYNFTMQGALKTFGQFLAMTKLTGHVYPFVFVWPMSFNLGYKFASKISATEINVENVLKLLCGLKEAGISRVHFLTHSMGVQTLLAAFKDKYDENGKSIGRSEVSKCFTLGPEFEDAGMKGGKRQQYGNQMVCKSITLLNPDFPVKAFVDRGFLSIRRICQTITVVGDRNDRALGFSSLINGVAPKFGYEQPEALQPTVIPSKPKWEFMERIGRSIEKLYFPPEIAQQYHDNGGKEDDFRRLLFNKSFLCSSENHYWLDMDVIDMTGLDTNIKGMRHSGFSLNGALVKDLQELFSTGKRAMKRSTLLFREGNQFSFAHAPSFVSQ